MPLVADCSAASRSILICFFFICQLTWILPCIFLVHHPRPSPKLSKLHIQNESRHVNAMGFAGPMFLGNGYMLSLKAIAEEWSALLPNLRGEYAAYGLNPPLERTCFIWLAECYNLAKHEMMAHIAKEAIGPNVLLYGMTVWDGENEALQKFHIDTELADCSRTMSFVFGTSIELISQSHKVPHRSIRQVILRLLTLIDRESLKQNTEADRFAKFEKLFMKRIRKLVESVDIRLERFEPANGFGVIIKGGTIFRLGKVLKGGRGLLMQYASADCKIRQSVDNSWGIQGTVYSLHVPPVLLVAGDKTLSSQFNDVRLSLVSKEVMHLKSDFSNVLGSSFMSEKKIRDYVGSGGMPEAGLFSNANANDSWQERVLWRFRTIGEISTTVISFGRIDQFQISKRQSHLHFHLVKSAGQQIIVALGEGLLYSRWVNGDKYHYYEVLELRPGSAVLLPLQFLHALKPLGLNSTFMSFRWIAHINDNLFEKSQYSGRFKITDGQDRLDKEFLGHGNTKAPQGRTVNLSSGQAYDPDNNENCDVLVFVIEGNLLQILPLNTTLQALDVLLIPANLSCVLWNIGGKSVRLFALHVCHFNNDIQMITSFGASGKIF